MKKFKRVLALILSIVVTATVADIPVTVNAAPPAGETYEDYDVVTYADLLDTGNHSLAAGGTTLSAKNNLFHYTATSSTHSAIYKFRYVAGADVYFQMFPGAYRSDDPFAYRIKNATTYEKRYAPNAATQAVGHTIANGEIIDFEIGRLMVATGTNAGNYYTYLKANDTLIFEGYATSSQISGTDLDDSIQLNLNDTNSCTITETPAPEPETYYDYDEVTYYDLRSGGNMLADEVRPSSSVYTFDQTSESGSTILKFRLKPVADTEMQFGFDTRGDEAKFAYMFGVQVYKTSEEYPNGRTWMRPGYSNSTSVALSEPFAAGDTCDIEFARLKVATGTNTGKYYVYLKMNGELISESYVAADVVDAGGNYTSNPGPTACTISNKIFMSIWGDGGAARITETPEAQRYYDYDEVTYYDMLDYNSGSSVPSGGLDLGSNQKLKYNVTSATHSAILKFRWTAGSAPRFAFYFDAWSGTAYPFCFVVKNPGYTDLGGDAGEYGAWHVYPSVGSHNVHMDSPIVPGNSYDIEFARLKVANGKYKNQYLVYLKVDGELIHSYYFDGVKADGSGYTGSNGTGTFSEQLRFNSSAAGNVISAIPVPETYYDYDEVTYYDLRSSGNALADEVRPSSSVYTYNKTSEYGSAVLKFRWKPATGTEMQLGFDTLGEDSKLGYMFGVQVYKPDSTYPNGYIWLRPGYSESTKVALPSALTTGNTYDIEFARLKVKTGQNTGKYYVYFKMDGELLMDDYVAASVVDGSGNYTSNPNSVACSISNKIYITNWGDGGAARITAIPIPVTYEDYDEIGYEDLTLNGDPVSDTGTHMSGATVFNYTPTSSTGSAVFKYRWKVGSSANFQLSFEKTSATAMEYMFGAWLYAPETGHLNGRIWLRPSYGPEVDLASALTTGSKHNVEFGRLKIKTGAPTMVGKYYVYLKIDDVLIAEDYVAANVVDASGNYTSNPGSTVCNVNAGEIIFTFWGSNSNVISAYKEPLPNGHQGITGDFDDDGIVNAGDVILLRKILAGAFDMTGMPMGIADFNSDGVVNLLDLIELKLYLAHTTSDTYSRSGDLVLGTQEHLLEDTTKTAAYIADASATLGADAYRLSMPIKNLYYATSSNGVGVYSDKMAELKSMVAALKAQGIDEILYVSDCFVLPYDYYNGTTNHNNTVPDPTLDPENYTDWLIVNAAAFGALAQEVPEIKYFEPYNEINLSDKRIEKPGIPWSATAAQQASHKYTVDEKAAIMADVCWHISKAVKAVDSSNQVTTPSISVADATIVQDTFLDALYDAIESGGYPTGHTVGDVNVDNYFTIVNLHLYPEFTDSNPATKINAFASRLNSAYSVMQSHKDGGAPVWLTETGVSSYHGDGAPRNENTAGTILTLTLNKINTNLTFIDTVFVYKIADISTSVGQTLCESGYGLFYSGDASSNRYVAKPTAKAVYSFFNGGTTDYSALTALTNRYN